MDQQYLEQLKNYFSLMTMNGGAYIFHTANEMGILIPFFKKGQLTSQDLSIELNLHHHATELFLNCLVAINILEKNHELYQLSPVMKLLSGDYQNLSSDYWKHLPILLKQGIPFKRMDQASDSEYEYQKQVKSLEWMMMPSADFAAKHYYRNHPLGDIKIIDLGAGSGVWSFAHLLMNPKAKATLVDWPKVLEVAKHSAHHFKISNKVTYIEGNYHVVACPEAYFDIAILGNVTHIETPEGNKSLFKKIKKSLGNNGELQIFDVFGTHKNGKLPKSLYEMGLSIRTVEGRVYSTDILKTWLQECGFSNFEYVEIDIEPYTMGMLKAI